MPGTVLRLLFVELVGVTAFTHERGRYTVRANTIARIRETGCADVVSAIGGLISATLLTLLVLPALYVRFNRRTSQVRNVGREAARSTAVP